MNGFRWIFNATALAAAWQAAIAAERPGLSLFQVDERALVSRSDLIYLKPAVGAGAGQPIGNGRMATLVWTTRDGVGFLINRTDVIGSDNTSENTYDGPTDEFGSVAWVSVRFGGAPFWPIDGFCQRLSLYDAECTIRGDGIAVRCFIASDRDVLVLEVDDTRATPLPLEVTVSTQRPAERVVGKHTTRCAAGGDSTGVFVTQVFQEKDYHNAAAAAARIVDAAAQMQPAAAGTLARTLAAPARAGRRMVFVSSAASWDATVDVLGEARRQWGDATAAAAYDTQRETHAAWWHDLWSRSFVHATSADGTADFLERVRNYHLYVLGCSSRGPLPARSARVFKSAQGREHWDGQFWLWNLDHQYYACYGADAFDLLEPFFAMYSRWLPNCEVAARQRWGAPGAFYPETGPFNGPKVLPEDVAKEFQDVMRGRKAAWELSERALAECSYDSQLAVVANARNKSKPDAYQLGRYTWISHYATGVLDIGLQFWWRYRATGDMEWLRDRAYPILRGGMEFYRGLAGDKGPDGRYHIYPTNARERFWGVRDSITDLAVIRGAGPVAIRAAELLDVDADLRGQWREFLDNLAAYPLGNEPECKALTGGVLKDDTWAAGRLGDVKGSRNGEIVWESPVFPYEHVTLATRDVDPALWDVAWRTCQAVPAVTPGSWSRTMLNIARMGDRERLPEALLGHLNASNMLAHANMVPGNDSAPGIPAAFQDAMLQCLSPRPGEPEVLMIYPCWPMGWNGSFRLLARGGFLVGSTIRAGRVGFVEIESRLGETCRLRNPWNGAAVTIESVGATREATGPIVEIPTAKGSRVVVYPTAASRPVTKSIGAPPQTEPAVARWRRPGKPDQAACLGIPRVTATMPPLSLARAGAPATGEVPRTGLRLWLRSDKGVVSSDGRVTAWEDQSGNGSHAAEGKRGPTIAADATYLGLPAIRFNGQGQYLRAAKGLGMNLPGPFTLVVVATAKDAWPRAIFSVVPERGAQTGRLHDYNSPYAFAFHYATLPPGGRGFTLTQGMIGGGSLGLTVPSVAAARPESVVIVRPVNTGQTVCGYVDGELSDLAGVDGTDKPVTQTGGYLIGSRWPVNLFGRNDIYEILVYDRALSDAELRSLHTYLLSQRTP